MVVVECGGAGVVMVVQASWCCCGCCCALKLEGYVSMEVFVSGGLL